MPLLSTTSPAVEFDHPASGGFDDTDAGDFLKPVIAGARARGVADGFEMLGVGAVLIDATGRVLHAGGRAKRMIGGHARIVGDHLVAEQGTDNAAFQTLIGSAIGPGQHDPETRVAVGDGRGENQLLLRAIRFASDEGDAQRLRAVLVLEEWHGAGGRQSEPETPLSA